MYFDSFNNLLEKRGSKLITQLTHLLIDEQTLLSILTVRLKSLPFSHANENRPFKLNNGIKNEREGAEKQTRATATGGYDREARGNTLEQARSQQQSSQLDTRARAHTALSRLTSRKEQRGEEQKICAEQKNIFREIFFENDKLSCTPASHAKQQQHRSSAVSSRTKIAFEKVRVRPICTSALSIINIRYRKFNIRDFDLSSQSSNIS